MHKIRGFKIRLRRNYIMRSLKYRRSSINLNEHLEKELQDRIEEAYSLITTSVIYDTFPLDTPEGKGILESVREGSSHIAEITGKADAITLMAATVGGLLEKRVDELKSTDLTGAFMLDAAGSEAAEQCVNFASSLLQEAAKKKDSLTGSRFSPGYGDWPLSASSLILKHLPFEKIGITLTGSGSMLPKKSVTALQSWLPK